MTVHHTALHHDNNTTLRCNENVATTIHYLTLHHRLHYITCLNLNLQCSCSRTECTRCLTYMYNQMWLVNTTIFESRKFGGLPRRARPEEFQFKKCVFHLRAGVCNIVCNYQMLAHTHRCPDTYPCFASKKYSARPCQACNNFSPKVPTYTWLWPNSTFQKFSEIYIISL